MRLHFSKLCKNGVISDKKFWSTIKPFTNNKGCHGNNNLTLYEGGNIAKDKIEVSRILNDFYINIVKHVTQMTPRRLVLEKLLQLKL